MFGIGWGVCALALISSSGDGFEKGQRENWKQLGDRIVMVFPGRTELQAGGRRAGRNIALVQSDVDAIRQQCPGVELAASEIKRWDVPAGSDWNSGRFLVLGVDPDYLHLRNLPAALGRHISWSDVQHNSRVCVLGESVRKQLFEGRKDAIGNKVRINGYVYTVVGLMSEKNQNSSYDGWDNDKILVPVDLVRTDCPPNRRVAPKAGFKRLSTGRVRSMSGKGAGSGANRPCPDSRVRPEGRGSHSDVGHHRDCRALRRHLQIPRPFPWLGCFRDPYTRRYRRHEHDDDVGDRANSGNRSAQSLGATRRRILTRNHGRGADPRTGKWDRAD